MPAPVTTTPSAAPAPPTPVPTALSAAPAPAPPVPPATAAQHTWQSPTAPPPVPGRRRTGRVAAIVAAALTVVVVGAIVWWNSHDTSEPDRGLSAGNQTPDQNQNQNQTPSDTRPNHLPSPTSATTAYPSLTGLDGALAAFGLVDADNADCTKPPLFGDKRNSVEQFACEWPTSTGGFDVYQTTIIRYPNAEAGFDALRANPSTATEAEWVVDGVVHGIEFVNTPVPGTGSITYTYCYTKVPYCLQIVDLQARGPQTALDRFTILSPQEAADLLSGRP